MRDRKVNDGFLVGNGQSEFISLLFTIPFLNIFVGILALIIFPIKLKKFLKRRKESKENFW